MKFRCAFLLIFLANSLFAKSGFELRIEWDNSHNKKVVLECTDSNLCRFTCGDALICFYTEENCYNCIGSELMTLNFFFSVSNGPTFRNKREEVLETMEFVFNLLNDGEDLIILDNQNIYDPISKYQSQKVMISFDSFCPENHREKTLLLFENEINFEKLSYVVCQSKRNAMRIFKYTP